MQSDMVTENFCSGARFPALLSVLVVFLLFLSIAHAQNDGSSVRFRGGGEIQVVVNGQGEAERADAYRIGLRWLLQDYAISAGERQIINHEATRQALSEPEKFVDAFEYTRIPEGQPIGSLPMSPSVRDSGAATHWITLQYSVPALNQLVAAANEEPSDADDTPATADNQTGRQAVSSRQALLWLLIEDQNLQLWVAPDTAANVVARLTELAGSHGYRLEFPLFDVTELALVGPETLDNPGVEEETRLRESATRYRFNQLIAGTIKSKTAGGWQVDLLRLFIGLEDQVTQKFKTDAATLDAALQAVVGWLAGSLDQNGRLLPSSTPDQSQSQSFAVTSGNSARIWIGGSIDSTAITRLKQYFSQNEAVEHASLSEIRANGVLYQIAPRSSLASVSSDLQAQTWLELGSREDGGFTDIEPPASDQNSTGPTIADASNTGGAVTTPVPEPRSPQADLYLRYVF